MERQDWLLASLLIHVPAVVAWVALVAGAMLIVTVPDLSPTRRRALIRRLRWPAVMLMLVILITGVWQTIDNPFVEVTSLEELERLRTTKAYGFALFVKHIFVIVTFGLTLFSTFGLAAHKYDLPPGAGTSMRPLVVVTALNLAACTGVLLATVGMTIQLH